MQRIHDVKKWKHVAAGGAMNFSDVRERRVRLDVNSSGPATLFYVDGNGETTLLALVHGRDVVEFHLAGPRSEKNPAEAGFFFNLNCKVE